MTYKNIAFLLPLLATSSIGGQTGVWKAQNPPANLAISPVNGSQMGLICPLEYECGDGPSASVTISQLLGATRVTVSVGASKDSAIVSSACADSVTLTIECDGKDVDLTIGTSANSWSEVKSCNQVGQE